MKARLKNTGEIVDVTRIVDRYVMTHHPHTITFEKDELDFDIEDDPDYWTRLEHRAAIAAMQALLSSDTMMGILSRRDNGTMEEEVAREAFDYAHALVEKMKEE